MAENIVQGTATEQHDVGAAEEIQITSSQEKQDNTVTSSQEESRDAGDISNNAEIEYFPDDIKVDPAVIDKLTEGFLALFLPNLQKAKGSLNEVLHNQEVLIETIQQENAKFTDSEATKKLADTMTKARQYHTKLVNLKKEMTQLMDRSTKLKRRAVKLQQQKQKEELQRAQQKEKEQEKERMLTAKVSKPGKDTKVERETT